MISGSRSAPHCPGAGNEVNGAVCLDRQPGTQRFPHSRSPLLVERHGVRRGRTLPSEERSPVVVEVAKHRRNLDGGTRDIDEACLPPQRLETVRRRRPCASSLIEVCGARATKLSDESTPTTDVGLQSSRIASVSAPVPQPTSTQRCDGPTSSQRRNPTATCRLQRPTYRSYAAALAHVACTVRTVLRCCQAGPVDVSESRNQAAPAAPSSSAPAAPKSTRPSTITRTPAANRLAATLPIARVVWIDHALTFSMLDQPDAVANAIRSVLTPASW